MDCSIVAKELGGGGHRNASGIVFNGLVVNLPYEIINDYGLLKIFLNFSKGEIQLCENFMTSFVMFKVDEIKQQWLQNDYLHLIKDKFQDYNLIVFQKKSDKIKYDENNNDIIMMYDYIIFFNELSTKDGGNLLRLMILNTSNNRLEFTSEKEFINIVNIFNDPQNRKNNELINNDSDDSDTDSEIIID